MADQHRVSVLCVCLGNICRSPLAAAVLKKLVADNGLSHVIRIDSAGTAGYHVGARADPRSEAECRKNNVPLKHSARKLSKQDFHEFDYILGMDRGYNPLFFFRFRMPKR